MYTCELTYCVIIECARHYCDVISPVMNGERGLCPQLVLANPAERSQRGSCFCVVHPEIDD